MDFVKSGIDDFDNLFANGGYPKGNQILVIGGPGSGKSIFSAQFLYSGAKDLGEPGVYVTLEESPEKINRNVASFGWDLKGLESEGKIRFIDSVSLRSKPKGEVDQDMLKEALDVDNMSIMIESAIDEISAKRLVIDSLSMMGLYTKDEFSLRSKLLRLSETISSKGVTTLLISEAGSSGVGVEDYPVEMFMFDGVITLELDRNSQERKISINKMRGAKHVIGAFRFKITDSGLEITL